MDALQNHGLIAEGLLHRYFHEFTHAGTDEVKLCRTVGLYPVFVHTSGNMLDQIVKLVHRLLQRSGDAFFLSHIFDNRPTVILSVLTSNEHAVDTDRNQSAIFAAVFFFVRRIAAMGF